MPTKLEQLKAARSIHDIASILEMECDILKYLLYAIPSQHKYIQFEIRKKSGGTRVISAPSCGLVHLQRRLYDILSEDYQYLSCCFGFINGRSVKNNAEKHLSARWVLNVDIKDFFPSINYGRVRGLFLAKPFEFSRSVATVLSQICCHNNQLPQGSPISPFISNLICYKLDKQLLAFAKARYCCYSRYADDITISKKNWRFPSEIAYLNDRKTEIGSQMNDIIKANGFELNSDKSRLHNNKSRLEVTGLTINKKVNVQRKYVRAIRAMIHDWRANGYEQARLNHFNNHLKRHYPTSDIVPYRNIIYGKMEYLKMIKGPSDSVYKNLQCQLVGVDSDYLTYMKKENDMLTRKDVFLSHASENKDIARALADALIKLGVSVWFDEYEIKLGDSITSKMTEGLRQSQKGIVLLSNDYVNKYRAMSELNALINIESIKRNSSIIPIWHKMRYEDVVCDYPLIVDLLSAQCDTISDTGDVARIIKDVL